MTLDLIMPGMTGWDVLKQLKANPDLRRIPVVVVSVVAGEGRGSLLGAVDLITKPFEREDLLRVLWRHLGRSRGGRILLVTQDARIKTVLGAFLRERGLEVVMPHDGVGPLEALSAELPDAVLLDLAPNGPVTMDVLSKIRSNRVYAGLPTFVLAEDDLGDEERDELQDLMTIVVSRADPSGALDDLLGALFPGAVAERRRVACWTQGTSIWSFSTSSSRTSTAARSWPRCATDRRPRRCRSSWSRRVAVRRRDRTAMRWARTRSSRSHSTPTSSLPT
jgi:CheY-like chemotaxis protein